MAEQRSSVPISEDEFLRLYPTLYHVTLEDHFEQIRRFGLRSTAALLDLFEIAGDTRFALENNRRRQMVAIHHPAYGKATLNDQAPLNESVLARCLTGMTPQDWIRELNNRVFFWPDLRRAQRFLSARLARDHKRMVLAIQTKELLRVSDSIELSAINSGTAVRNAPARGPRTFLPLALYPFAERRARYGLRGAIAEVTVAHAILEGDLFYRVDLGD